MSNAWEKLSTCLTELGIADHVIMKDDGRSPAAFIVNLNMRYKDLPLRDTDGSMFASQIFPYPPEEAIYVQTLLGSLPQTPTNQRVIEAIADELTPYSPEDLHAIAFPNASGARIGFGVSTALPTEAYESESTKMITNLLKARGAFACVLASLMEDLPSFVDTLADKNLEPDNLNGEVWNRAIKEFAHIHWPIFPPME